MGMKEYVHVAFTSVHQEQIPPIPVNFKISFIFFSGLTISTSHHYSLSIFMLHSLYFFTCSFPFSAVIPTVAYLTFISVLLEILIYLSILEIY